MCDPDLDVQNKAVEVLIQANHPETIKFLVPALKDESEYTRRSAVEVLNEIGNADSVKDLLNAIKDDDWWVRSRAGDALGEIGGPKVVDSVVSLIKSEDEDIRRTAIEILNTTKDERAVDSLLKATDDSDWWVRERSVDALSKIGSPKAIPKLLDMLGKNAKTDPVVIRAISALGDHKHITKVMPMLKSSERDVQVEAIKAVSHLANDAAAETVRGVLQKIKQSDDPTIINNADKALKDLDARFSNRLWPKTSAPRRSAIKRRPCYWRTKSWINCLMRRRLKPRGFRKTQPQRQRRWPPLCSTFQALSLATS